MVSHPETGSDSPIGSDRESERDIFKDRSGKIDHLIGDGNMCYD